jgi:type III pantothenate kinase
VKLCIDVGNSQIYGGLFAGEELVLRFRKITPRGASSDELGVFFRQALKENGHDPAAVTAIGFCSVVPDINHSLGNACRRYFGLEPFNLRAGVKTGLRIRTKNPSEVGADRIAGAVGAVARYPDEELVIIDFGTATTVEAVSAERDYLGGVILPGLLISMHALVQNTAGLPKVEILRPERCCGRSTVECIQSGLYWGHLGMVRETRDRLAKECFADRRPVVVATGGFAGLFADSGLYDAVAPDLALEGVRIAQEMNQ